MKEYNKDNISFAKALRENMTPWERKLWYEYLRFYPVRFQRQKAIGNYIVDFYCAKARLVIELDGGGHYEPEQIQKDTERTGILQSMNLSVLRICNLDIDRNFTGVCELIDNTVRESLPQSAPPTAPSSEGAKERKNLTIRNSLAELALSDDKPPSEEGGGTALAVTEGENESNFAN